LVVGDAFRTPKKQISLLSGKTLLLGGGEVWALHEAESPIATIGVRL